MPTWWLIGQMYIANGGRETIARVGADMFMKREGGAGYYPLIVTYPEHIPTRAKPIGILHFEDNITRRIGTLVCESDTAVVCYNGQPANPYITTLINKRTETQLPAIQRA